MIRHLCYRLLAIITSTILLVLLNTHTIFAQSGGLNNVSAVLNDVTISVDATLTISFNLPPGSSPIRHADYIQIYLEGFTVNSPPSFLGGSYAGFPNYSIVGRTIKITNIAVAPGNKLTIYGINVINPPVPEYWPVRITVTQDEAGEIIKNLRIVDATKNPGTISVSASIDIPYARVYIEGSAGPETFITFTEAGSVIGTDLSGFDGHFGHLWPGLEPGDHQFTFYGVDRNRLVTTPITVSLYTPAFQETFITNQILSPTISINKSIYNPTENLVASGSAVPNGDITLFTQSPLRTYSTTADNDGNWLYSISNLNLYLPGDYHIYTLVQSNGFTSLNSPSIGFSVRTTGGVGTACGDIYQGDLDCDGNIDLTDFSILMYYWGTGNAIADINLDNFVNLTDFSIMMYWWGT